MTISPSYGIINELIIFFFILQMRLVIIKVMRLKNRKKEAKIVQLALLFAPVNILMFTLFGIVLHTALA